MFEVCDVVLINKVDVLPYFDFDIEKCKENIHYRIRMQRCLKYVQKVEKESSLGVITF